jgi:hypothetical protein
MRVVLSFSLLIFCLFSELHAQKIPGNDSFIAPLHPPYFFSGDFGELRPSHFHSGLDFRTQGRTGLPVLAVKDGYISRIGISATGYGNALYMNHPDGTTSVYGHLERFQPKIQEYVEEQQYHRESFQVTLTPSSGEFNFRKGDIIAWSGNSGSSGGPHLHFEIRDTKSERAYNPILYNIGIKDNSAPKIMAINVYPLSPTSNVDQDRIKRRYETVSVPGGYRLKANLPIELYGKIGFGIQAEDYISGVGLKIGIYSATLLCDGKQVFGFKMESFSFDDTRYSNSQADYEEYLKSHRWIQRLYRQPGNHLDIYDPANKNGILNLDDGKGHEFEIVVSDAFKNRTSLKFRTVSKKSSKPANNPFATKHFDFDQSNDFETDNIKVEIPKGALYDDLGFVYKSGPKPAGCYSALQQVHSKFVPLQKPYTLSIKCDGLPEEYRSKALIAFVDPASGKKSAVGGEYSGGWVTVKTYLFGSFSIAVDKTPPVIVPLSIKDKKTLTDKSKVQFKITDDFSGIKSYRGEIDGKWVLFVYDPKSSSLTYTFDKIRMTFGKTHLLRLMVTDSKDNKAEYKAIIFK